MNKSELIKKVSDRSPLSAKKIANIINIAIDVITESLQKEDNVMLTGFGTFHIRSRSAHVGKHPRTGKIIIINATKIPVFKAGKVLKQALNKVHNVK